MKAEALNELKPDDRTLVDHRTLVLGVRDSGVGGLTVARQLALALPAARLLYFADTAHVPYGDKTPAQVRHYALSISEFLIDAGADAVVFACNTTSAYALDEARARFQEPVFGVIEPGARAATAVTHGRIGVLATSATVQSGVFTSTLQRLNGEILVREVPCPAFVPLIEGRRTQSVEAREACKHYLAPLLRAEVDTVILGCTHYPLLLPVMQELAPHLCFVDPAEAVTEEVVAAWRSGSLVAANRHQPNLHRSAPKARFFVSGPQEGVREWVEELLPVDEPKLEPGPVFDL